MIDFSLQKTLSSAEGRLELDVNARLEKGQFISLYGVSGAGKTSLLRMLAGLMKPDSGFITVNGTVWFDAARKIDIAPQHRQIGFVFQDYALFPNMNVRENVSFGLNRNDPRHIVDELLEVSSNGWHWQGRLPEDHRSYYWMSLCLPLTMPCAYSCRILYRRSINALL
jgi:molybdate transport system ATP-binding protein